MPAPNGSTFDGNPNASTPVVVPYRPGAPDFNGIGLQDNPQYPPNPLTMPTAALLNTWSALSVVFGRMIPVLRLSVTGGTTPSISQFIAAPDYVGGTLGSSTPTPITLSTFTVTHVSTGKVQITWPAGTLPTATTQPSAHLNGVLSSGYSASVSATPITNGVEVDTLLSGVYSDMSFTVDVY
jgi:hypothetical protein